MTSRHPPDLVRFLRDRALPPRHEGQQEHGARIGAALRLALDEEVARVVDVRPAHSIALAVARKLRPAAVRLYGALPKEVGRKRRWRTGSWTV